MDLETPAGALPNITGRDLDRLLASPVPLFALRGPGVALVALHNQNRHYSLLLWNGRVWQCSRPEVPEGHLAERLSCLVDRRGNWRADLDWENFQPGTRKALPFALPCGAHIFLSFLLTFGGFTAGTLLGYATGRQIQPHDSLLIYGFAATMAPVFAILGQSLARRIPAACTACDEPTVCLHAARFTYLCTECGHITISRWGINRSPFGA